MIPVSISASALTVANDCLARYCAENIKRAPRSGDTSAADLGTAVHGALELYVKHVYLDKQGRPDLQWLLDLYRMQFQMLFGDPEDFADWYPQGVEMLERWFARNPFHDREVISCERKDNFPAPNSYGLEIPLNYIWDRCDRVDDGSGKRIIEVVDYKTIRATVSPEQLRKKIQAKVYALAAAIQFKGEYDEIWITFDLLRYEPVGVVFKRSDLESMWEWIKASLDKIIETPDDEAPETLNPDCRYCIRKANCDTLHKNIAVGGVMGLDAAEAAKLKYKVEAQMKAYDILMNELDTILVREAEEQGVLDLEYDEYKVSLTARRTRTADGERVASIIGPELAAAYSSFTMATIDKLLKGKDLSDDQKAALRSVVRTRVGEMKPKVERPTF